MTVSLKKVITQDQDLKRVQDSVDDALNRVQTGPFFNGNITSGSLTSGQDNVLTHGLGKTPSVWIICDQSQGVAVWRTGWDKNTITLRSSGNCNVSVWVS